MALLDHVTTRPQHGVARRRVSLELAMAGLDALIIVCVTLVALAGRNYLPVFDPRADVNSFVQVAGVFIVVGWIVALAAVGAYDRAYFGAGTDEYRLVLNASLITAASVGITCYLAGFHLSRGFFVLLFLLGPVALLLGRMVMRRLIHRARSRGHLVERVLLAGTPSHILDVAKVLQREKWLGYSIVGCVLPSGHDESEVGTIPVLGTTTDVAPVIDRHSADVVFFASGAFTTATGLRRAVWDLEQNATVRIVVAPNLTDVSHQRVQVRPVAGLPLVHLQPPRTHAAAQSSKRAFDLVIAVALLTLSAPVLALVALWVKLYDGGPVLYRQVRVGKDGELFCCLKFRSMVMDADQQSPSLTRDDGQSDHVLFKMAHDPRVTRPGRFLRRFSLDELPQLVNVLRGHMSLVGPRPPLPAEVERYEPDMRRRLHVRPGMTGLWQISGRADLSWEDTVRLDLYYVDNWSMVQDINILARTLWVVLTADGAY